MLSFCVETWGGVAESMIQQRTFALLERGAVLDGGWGPGIRVFHHPSSALTGTFSLGEKVFLHFLKQWILQLRAGMPFVQNDILETLRTDSWAFVTWCNFMNVCCLHEQIRQLRRWCDRKCTKTFSLNPLFVAVHRQLTSGENNLLH